MNKNELIAAMAEEAGRTKADTGRILDSFISVVQEALVAGKKVAIPGLGVLSVKTRAARVSRNPKTGEPIQVAEKRAVSFKVGKRLKAAVNTP